MEIKNCLNAVNAYNKVKLCREKTENASVNSGVKNTDKVEFSKNATSAASLKADVSEKVMQSADNDRIAELSQRINSGSYNIACEIVANSILG